MYLITNIQDNVLHKNLKSSLHLNFLSFYSLRSGILSNPSETREAIVSMIHCYYWVCSLEKNRVIQVRLVMVREKVGPSGWRGRDSGIGVRFLKGNGNKSTAQGHILLKLFLKCHSCIYLEEKKALDVSKSLSKRTCLLIIFNHLEV